MYSQKYTHGTIANDDIKVASSPDAPFAREDPLKIVSLPLSEIQRLIHERQSEVSQRYTWSKALSRTGPANNKRSTVKQRGQSSLAKEWLFNHKSPDLRYARNSFYKSHSCTLRFHLFAERTCLHGAFTRVSRATTRVALVSGHPSIGGVTLPPPCGRRGPVDAKTSTGTRRRRR